MEESKTNDVDVIKRSMSDEAFDEAVKLTRSALESQEVDKDVAEHIKTQMEKKFHGSWYVFFPIRFPFASLVFVECPSHPFYIHIFCAHFYIYSNRTHHLKLHSYRHCIVGKNFGCSVEFDPTAMCAYKISNKSVFLFRSPKTD